MELREQLIRSEMESCRHFNGIQHEACRAGVRYRRGGQQAMPCIPKFINGRDVWPCELFALPTREEAEADADKRMASIERTDRAFSAARQDADSRGLKKGHGGAGSLPCPACNAGTLRYSVASYNGHMHGRCSTDGCVSWMQ